MKAINILKNHIRDLEKMVLVFDEYAMYKSRDESKKAIQELTQAIKELEELETKDRLAELEKVILDYYLAKGYRIGVGGWAFRVEIISFYKHKRIVVYFKEHHLVNSSFAFSTINKSTKEMFDKAFEHFSLGE